MFEKVGLQTSLRTDSPKLREIGAMRRPRGAVRRELEPAGMSL